MKKKPTDDGAERDTLRPCAEGDAYSAPTRIVTASQEVIDAIKASSDPRADAPSTRRVSSPIAAALRPPPVPRSTRQEPALPSCEAASTGIDIVQLSATGGDATSATTSSTVPNPSGAMTERRSTTIALTVVVALLLALCLAVLITNAGR